MANYTFATSPLQEAALVRHVAQVNEQRRGTGQPPFADTQAFITSRVVELLTPIIADFAEEEAQNVKRAYLAAGLSTKAQVKTDLGL